MDPKNRQLLRRWVAALSRQLPAVRRLLTIRYQAARRESPHRSVRRPIVLGLIACSALLLGPAASAQGPLAVPVDDSGDPVLPAGSEGVRTSLIETVAGSWRGGYGGDGGLATKARLNHPSGIAIDAAGNVYLADARNHRVRKIDFEGRITTVAGTGAAGYGGDGGPASEALLNHPLEVAVDAAGNVYVADYSNHRVRRIDLAGVITTIAGSGESGYGGDGGPATAARLHRPTGLAVDTDGSVYVADSWNHRVRRVDPEGVVTTVAGSGRQGYMEDGIGAERAALNYPSDVALDAAGNLYIADWRNFRVRRVDVSGIITTLAGTGESGYGGDGGPAAAALLASPNGVAVDAEGSVYVSDQGNQRIRKINAEGVISTLAGTGERGFSGDGGPATEGRLALPAAVAADAGGNVYVTDRGNQRVRVVRPGVRISVPLVESGESVEVVVLRDGTVRRDGERLLSGHIVTDSADEKFALTPGPDGGVVANPVQQVQSVGLVGGGTVTVAQYEDNTWRIGATPVSNGYRYVHEGRESVLELAGGSWRLAQYMIRTVAGHTGVTDGILATEASLPSPRAVAVDQLGNVYVADSTDLRVRKIDPAGIITTVAGTGDWGHRGDGGPATEARLSYTSPWDIATGSEGNLYIADGNNFKVRKVDTAGVITTFAGSSFGYSGDGGLATDAGLRLTTGVAVGPSGSVYIAEPTNHSVRKIDSSGIITTVAGRGGRERGYEGDGGLATEALLNGPSTVAADAAGNVYIADQFNHRIRKVDAAGIITTFAGTGERGDGGDGGPATDALLSFPRGLAVDAGGNIYVAVAGARVRKIDPAGIITTFAGTGEFGDSGDGGPATEARFGSVADVAVDSAGNLYIADSGYSTRIRKVDPAGTISTIAGTGDRIDEIVGPVPAAEAKFLFLAGAALDGSGNLYFIDNNRVLRLDRAGMVSPFAGTGRAGHEGDGGPAIEASLDFPQDLAFDTSGNLYLAELFRIRKIDAAGVITSLAGSGESGFAGDGGQATEAEFNQLSKVATDVAGNVYVADRRNHRVRKIDATGVISTFVGTGEQGSEGIGGLASDAQINNPNTVATDSAGHLYLTEWDRSGRVLKVDKSGIISTLAESRELAYAQSLTTNESGNVYLATWKRIYRIDPDGTISLIAQGHREFGGDGEPAGGAGPLLVRGIAVDQSGTVWFTDTFSRRIRVLEPYSAEN